MAALTLEQQLEELSEELHIESKHHEKMRSLLEQLRNYHLPTYEHSIRVSLTSSKIARHMHLNTRPTLYGGVLHDVGKLEIPFEILNKTQGFSEEDMGIMKSHVQKGYEMLMKEGYVFSAWLALTHHYYQKNSYPLVLPEKPEMFSHGTSLLVDVYARIVSIADHNDALKRRNDKFGPAELKKAQAREIMLMTNPDQRYLIEYLYNEGVLT